MIRYMLTALCAALAAACVPSAAAQTVTGCSSVASNRVATSKDVAKLTADADCFDVAKTNAEAGAAIRRARIAALAKPVPPAPPRPTVVEPATIASKLDVAALLVPAWGTGEIPASGKPDVVGAFRFACAPGPVGNFDFIVYPGQRSPHPHQFFGNTAVNKDTTYESLRTTGDSTCGNALNRSSLWLPAMLDGKGMVVRPDFLAVYYKRRPPNDPECQRQGKACVDLPRALRMVFGYNMLDHLDPPTGAAWFNCDGPTAKSGHFKDIVEAAVGCPVGNRLGATINAPDCWNGKDLDSPDHRSHVAYASYGDWGYLRCPSTHPFVIPTFTMTAWYTVDENLDRSGTFVPGKTVTWHFASDVMKGMPPMRPGSTIHGDYAEGWEDAIRTAWEANCLNKLLNCTAGDLGDGRQLKGGPLVNDRATPRVVPIPND